MWNRVICAAGTIFYWNNLEKKASKGGKKQQNISMESGVVVVWGRDSEQRKYEQEVKRGAGGIAASQRDRREESRV